MDAPERYHAVEWTPDRIRRFWNFYSQNAAAQESYFGRRFGPAIVHLVRRHVSLASPVVDLGCGPGYLLEELLRQGFACQAIDASAGAVDHVRRRFTGHSGFLGGHVGSLDRLPLADGAASAVFLVEVLEHLGPALAATALAEVYRILRPEGCVVITVPNAEDLQANSVACPDCGCVFHRMQHVQSFTRRSLEDSLRGSGFEAVWVEGLHLKHFAGNGLTRSLGGVRYLIRALRRRPTPHLVGIGRRPPA